jgi:NhaA family Na+:H+ antiporter
MKRFVHSLLESESGSGLVLIGAAALALLIANSPLAPAYFAALEHHAGPLSVLHWINDAAMAVFFLLIGLEIKREFVGGELSAWPQRVLPGLAAVGGMVVPAAIYLMFNRHYPENLSGWAVPTATDIAFALGVLSLLGSRIPKSLKLFLTALAIIDDLGAVAIIALLYTAGLQPLWLASAALVIAVLWSLNRFGVTCLAPYLVLGAVLWFLVHESGVHATIAGVLLALTIPVKPDHAASPLHKLEHFLQPWVGFIIVPLFGFANAGVTLGVTGLEGAALQVPMGIAIGLFVGKQLGVFSMTWGAIKLGWAPRPEGTSLRQLYGVSVLCGIGFTMSLFIGLLAFPEAAELQGGVKLGVLAGSVASALLGVAFLLKPSSPRAKIPVPPSWN